MLIKLVISKNFISCKQISRRGDLDVPVVTEWLCVLIDVAGMSLAFIMGSISSRDRKVLVCSRCFCDLRNIIRCWGYSRSGGISADYKMYREMLWYFLDSFFTLVTVFCDHLSLFSFFSPCSFDVCECMQPSKWRLQKKERKENQLGTPVIVPFPSQICRRCMWSQPPDKCTHNIAGK